MWNLKNNTNEYICKTETDSQITKQTSVNQREEEMGWYIMGMGLRNTNYSV